MLVGVVGTFGLNFQITLALVDKVVFHRGAAAYGLLSALLAAGALAGALLGARRTHPTTRLVVLAAIAFGLLEVAAGFMPVFALLAIALVPTGLANITFSTAANSSVQLAASPEMRGRVMGVYMLVFAGGTPFGAPLVGWISQEFGARWGLIGGGAVSAAAAAALLAFSLRRAGSWRDVLSGPATGSLPVSVAG
jgi:MFS family permease